VQFGAASQISPVKIDHFPFSSLFIGDENHPHVSFEKAESPQIGNLNELIEHWIHDLITSIDLNEKVQEAVPLANQRVVAEDDGFGAFLGVGELGEDDAGEAGLHEDAVNALNHHQNNGWRKKKAWVKKNEDSTVPEGHSSLVALPP